MSRSTFTRDTRRGRERGPRRRRAVTPAWCIAALRRRAARARPRARVVGDDGGTRRSIARAASIAESVTRRRTRVDSGARRPRTAVSRSAAASAATPRGRRGRPSRAASVPMHAKSVARRTRSGRHLASASSAYAARSRGLHHRRERRRALRMRYGGGERRSTRSRHSFWASASPATAVGRPPAPSAVRRAVRASVARRESRERRARPALDGERGRGVPKTRAPSSPGGQPSTTAERDEVEQRRR